MKKILNCRRSMVAVMGVVACLIISLALRIDTSTAILGIVTAIAGANATQKIMEPKRQETANEQV